MNEKEELIEALEEILKVAYSDVAKGNELDKKVEKSLERALKKIEEVR